MNPVFKIFLGVVVFLVYLLAWFSDADAADNQKLPKNTGHAFVLSNAGDLWPAQVCYTTDGNSNIIPISSSGGGGGGTVIQGAGASSNSSPWFVEITDGTNNAPVTSNGLKVDGSGVTQPVTVGNFPASFGVTQLTSPWVISGNTGRTWSLGFSTDKVDASGSALSVTNFPLSFIANIGTTGGLALDTSVLGLQVSQGSTTSGQKGALALAAVSAGNPSYTDSQTSPLSLTLAGALRTDSSSTTQPVSGTVAVSNFPVTQPVSGTVTANAGTGTFTVGQSTAANLNATVVGPSGVALAKDSSLTLINTTLGSPFQAGGSIGNTAFGISGTLPAFSSTPTFNVGTTGGLALDATVANVQGSVAGGTAASKSELAGGVYNSSAPTLTNGQQASLQFDVSGNLKTTSASGSTSVTQGTTPWVDNVTQFGSNNVVTGTGASGLGIPRFTVSNDSNILATQSGAWSVTANAGTNLNTSALALDSTLSAFKSTNHTDLLQINSTLGSPFQAGGSIGNTAFIANAGTNLNTSALALDTSVNGLLLSQGSTTSGQKGPLLQGSVTTAAPTYTTAQTSPFSLTTAGALRTDSSGSTQPVSGTVTALQGTSPWVTSRNWTLSSGSDSVAAVQSGTWTVQPGNTANTTPWLSTINQGGNSATVTASNALKVDGSAVTQPVSGTVTSNQGGAPWSQNITQVSGTNVSATNGLPSRITNGTTFVDPTQIRALTSADVVTANAGTGTFTVGQSTASNLNAQVVGNVASGSTDSGNPVKAGAVFNTTQPTVTNGQRVDLQGTARGGLIVSTGTDTFHTNVDSSALPTGSSTAANQASQLTQETTTATNTGTIATNQTSGGQKSQRVDGSGNVAPAGDTAARAGFQKITDGTNTAAVKAASTAPVATDPALVVGLSPNSSLPPAADVVGSGSITGIGQSVTVNTSGCSTLTFAVTGTWSATLIVTGTVNGVAGLQLVQGYNPITGLQNGGVVSANATFQVPCAGFGTISISPFAFTSGTVTVNYQAGAGVAQVHVAETPAFTGLTANAPTTATVGVATAQALATNANRKGLVLVNTSVNRISCTFGQSAVLNSGITLYPGGSFVMDPFTMNTTALDCIASAASSGLSIQEFQ